LSLRRRDPPADGLGRFGLPVRLLVGLDVLGDAAECEHVFRTTDPEHPGVKMVMAQGDVNLAGPVKVLSMGGFPESRVGIFSDSRIGGPMSTRTRSALPASISRSSVSTPRPVSTVTRSPGANP